MPPPEVLNALHEALNQIGYAEPSKKGPFAMKRLADLIEYAPVAHGDGCSFSASTIRPSTPFAESDCAWRLAAAFCCALWIYRPPSH